ncbi:MAG TPA: type I 3-dehydroquinate dehydratase, partial [Phycisphaerales bacterium]|nr:type I 3-dehydroquinate dehydratase [Phycisphaerales bacterium]
MARNYALQGWRRSSKAIRMIPLPDGSKAGSCALNCSCHRIPPMLYHFAMTRLAVPIAAATPAEAGRQALAAQNAGAEMLELRLDYLKDLTPDAVTAVFAEITAQCINRPPIIATCRDKAEGGS